MAGRSPSSGPLPVVARPAAAPARAEVVFTPAAESVGRARRVVREVCRSAGVGQDALDTAELLTSEVVTNAFVHGRSEARLVVRATRAVVRVEVGDDNSRHPRLQVEDHEALDGRGLLILEVAASRWGVRADEVGKTVWFEVDAAPGGAR